MQTPPSPWEGGKPYRDGLRGLLGAEARRWQLSPILTFDLPDCLVLDASEPQPSQEAQDGPAFTQWSRKTRNLQNVFPVTSSGLHPHHLT